MIRTLKPHQLTVDIVVGALFGLLLIATTFSDGLPGAIVLIGMSASLALRRLSPGIALGIAWVTVGVQLLSGMQAVLANAAILAVLYATGAYGDRIVKWAGLVSACVGGVIAAVYTTLVLYAGDPLTASGAPSMLVFTSVLGSIAAVFVLGLSWTIGLLVRTNTEAQTIRVQRYQALAEQRAAQQAVVVEQERNRIARDMHDVVAHSLAVVIAQADGARYAYRGNPEKLEGTMGTIAETARGALGDVRLLLSELRHRQGDGPQPVLEDLDRLFDQMGAAGLRIERYEYGRPYQLPTGHQIALYRIVQEALTNALRHGSSSSRVKVEQWWMPDGVSVRIANSTADAQPSGAASAGRPAGVGHGLPGMRERAELVGGWLTVEHEHEHERFVVSGFLPAPNGPHGALNPPGQPSAGAVG